MFQQGDFHISPQQVDERRRRIMQMMPRFGSASYTGEGLAHMLSGILGGRNLRSLDRYEDAQRKRVGGMFADMEQFDPWMTAAQRKAMK
jgi:hypothetical protein